jgi:hypothetical protein
MAHLKINKESVHPRGGLQDRNRCMFTALTASGNVKVFRRSEAITTSEPLSMSPLVSVIIPAFNAASFIEGALQSALGQTYERLEVIVVDDGSQDETAALVEAVAAKDPRVTLLRQENAGVAAARNLAIEHSRGTYVAPLDADDRWHPMKLEREVARLEAGGPEMGMVYSWWVAVNEDGGVTGATTPLSIEGDLHECLVWINFVGAASVPIFRRSALDRVGYYDPSLRARGGQGCEDWDLTLRVAEHFEVGVVPAYLTEYRVVVGSMSFNCASMARSYDLVMEAQQRRRPELPERLLRWSRGNFEGYLAHMSYASGQYRDAIMWKLRSIRWDPSTLLGSWTVGLTLKALIRLGAREAYSRGLIGGRVASRLLHSTPPPVTTLAAVAETTSPQGSPWTSGRPYAVVRQRRWEWLLSRSRVAVLPAPPVAIPQHGICVDAQSV